MTLCTMYSSMPSGSGRASCGLGVFEDPGATAAATGAWGTNGAGALCTGAGAAGRGAITAGGRALGRGGLSGRVAGCAAVGLGLAAGNADGDMTVVRNGAGDAGGRGAESGTCTTSVRVGTKRGGGLGGGSAISQLSAPSRGE